MTTNCEQYRARMFEYAQGELRSLERTHFESHLASCSQCSQLSHSVDAGLAAARNWDPTVDDEHVNRLLRRLAPYVEESRQPRAPFWSGFALAGAALAAAAVLFFVTSPSPSPERSRAPVMVAQVDAPAPSKVVAPEPSAPAEQRVVRKRLRPKVRALASADWDGALTGKNQDVLKMSRGFAVLALDAPIDLETPALEAKALGRVFVEFESPDQVTLGVMTGRVAVQTLAGLEELTAGQSRSFAKGRKLDRTSTTLHAPKFGDDEFLRPIETAALSEPTKAKQPKARAKRANKKRRRRRPSRGRSVKSLARQMEKPDKEDQDVLQLLDQAENLARSGAIDRALELYRSALTANKPAFVPYRGLIRYEIARIQAFELKEVDTARDELERIRRSESGEVRTQASFTLCELDLEDDPCQARACLEDLAKQSGPGVKKEANSLIERWGLSECE